MFSYYFSAALYYTGVLGAPSGRPDNHALNRARADAVKEAFQYAWDGYYDHAFPHDELHPVSNSFSDSR